MFAQLGSIIFNGMKSFNTLDTTNETNIVEHAIIEGKPKLQKVGEKLDTIQMTMMFSDSFCNVQAEIDALNDARKAVEVMPLIMGDGLLIGDYVIKTLKVKRTDAAMNGKLLQAEVQVDLIEFYTADREQATETAAINAGIGMAMNFPQEFVPVITSITPEAIVSDNIVQSTVDSLSSANIMSSIGAVSDQVRQKTELVMRQILRVGDSIDSVLHSINLDIESEMYERTRELAINCQITINLVSDIVTECSLLIADIDSNNVIGIAQKIVNLTQKGTELKTRATSLMASATSLSSMVIVQ